MTDPIRHAQKPGQDRITVAVARPPSVSSTSEPPLSDQQQLLIDAKPLAVGATPISGAIDGAPDLVSRGVGDGRGGGRESWKR